MVVCISSGVRIFSRNTLIIVIVIPINIGQKREAPLNKVINNNNPPHAFLEVVNIKQVETEIKNPSDMNLCILFLND